MLWVMSGVNAGAAAAAEVPGKDASSEALVKEAPSVTLPPAMTANHQSRAKSLEASLAYIQVAVYGYDSFQPWKRREVSQRNAFAVAVGDYELLTTADNVSDAAFIKVRRYGHNEFIPAKVKVVDYEVNLCLLEVDAAEAGRAFVPVRFSETYAKGAKVTFHWLAEEGDVLSGRGVIGDARVMESATSFAQSLRYIITNNSRPTGRAELFCLNGACIGLGSWYDKSLQESGVIPAVLINHFLQDVQNEPYAGLATVGFSTSELLDPIRRARLKMDPNEKNGIYVNDVYSIGTGSAELRVGDVILAIEGKAINGFGRFMHPEFEWTGFEHLISTKAVGETLRFDLWRDGQRQRVDVVAKNFKAADMLVPYYEYDHQPEYVVTGGFVFQKLTLTYLQRWGKNWHGRVAPLLAHYYDKSAFKPTPSRRDIIILNLVLPLDINLGYHNLRQEVVKSINGMTITSMADVLKALQLQPNCPFDVVKLEMDNPTIVIPRNQLAEANVKVQRGYGVRKLVNVKNP